MGDDYQALADELEATTARHVKIEKQDSNDEWETGA